jgi:NitT/TauT family transport system ATP-binding protein
MVTGLITASSGYVFVAGGQVGAEPVRVGMAFQNPTLLPWRQTLSNVLLPFEIVEQHRYRIRMDRTGYEKQARALLHSVGLAGFESKYPWELSGGMQQRVSLCRALVHQPALLMLDEPFGALDAFTREDLWDVLQDLWLERHCTTILVTHDLREAVYLADRVHVMSNRPGHIVATHEVPLDRPRRPDTLYEPRFIDIVHALREQIRAQSVGPSRAPAETVR